MKKYIFITALILSNIAWAMETKKQITKKLENSKIDHKKDGEAALDYYYGHSGILPQKTTAQGSSKLFKGKKEIAEPLKSKL